MKSSNKKQKPKKPGQNVFKVTKKKSSCPICKKEFDKNWNLERHLLGRHKIPKDDVGGYMQQAVNKQPSSQGESSKKAP